MVRVRVVAVLLAAVLVVSLSASQASQARQDPPPPAGVTLTGLDAHDGTIVHDGDTWYLYGTHYRCGFEWGVAGTPWCGFGVFSAPSLAGPWTYLRLLFPPSDGDYAWGWATWSWVCGSRGGGCFNPRMMRRGDGVWILYFNAPEDAARGATSSLYAMGCAGPAGPCGDTVPGIGSTHRMEMGACRTGWGGPKNGDFSVFADGDVAYLVCSDGRISIEKLDVWWTNGTADPAGHNAVQNIAYMTDVEGPGVYHAADGTWAMTLSDPSCGYCAGTELSYITSPNGPLGVWLAPQNTGANGPRTGRSRVNSCGGQPRTIFVVDGQPYQWIDTWTNDFTKTPGFRNQTLADVRIEPLIQQGPLVRQPDGHPWGGGYRPFTCGAGQ
jgi:hypothetical protein